MPNLGWRYLLGLSSIPIFLSAISFIWLPESPRFYMGIHRPDVARRIIKRVSDENKSDLPEEFELQPLEMPARAAGRVSDLFSEEHRFHTVILWLIWFGNMVLYYGIVLVTTEMFKSENACGKCELDGLNYIVQKAKLFYQFFVLVHNFSQLNG